MLISKHKTKKEARATLEKNIQARYDLVNIKELVRLSGRPFELQQTLEDILGRIQRQNALITTSLNDLFDPDIPEE